MAAPKVGGLRTMSSRSEAGADAPDPSVPAQTTEKYKYIFQAKKSELWVSVSERTTRFLPNGTPREELPKTKAGNRLDMVRFKDFYLRTNDDELAEALKGHPSYGVTFRDYADVEREQKAARAAEIRAALASDPELAKAVRLSAGEGKDWSVTPRGMSDEEMEAATRPDPK